MTGRWKASLVVLLLAPAACAQTHGPIAIEIRDASNSASGQAGHATPAGGTRGTIHSTLADAGRSSTGHDGGVVEPVTSGMNPAAGTAAGVPATNGETEVWIGQLWSVMTPALCDPYPASSTASAVQPMGYTDRVVLILEHGVNAALQGRIQLGEGALPTSPGEPPYNVFSAGQSAIYQCSVQVPTKGVEYPLLDPVLTSDRLMFEISSSDVWNTWCQAQVSPCPGPPDGTCPPQGPICACENGSCKAAEHAHVVFALAVTADTIEGELPYRGGAFGTPAQLRLRRVQ